MSPQTSIFFFNLTTVNCFLVKKKKTLHSGFLSSFNFEGTWQSISDLQEMIVLKLKEIHLRILYSLWAIKVS